jgi:hypothetical protein
MSGDVKKDYVVSRVVLNRDSQIEGQWYIP